MVKTLARVLLVLLTLIAPAPAFAAVSVAPLMGGLDDGPVIQAAVNSCVPGGCVVNLLPGDFLLRTTVTVPHGVQVVGEGAATAVHVDGPIFGFAFNGSVAAVRSLWLDAVTPQVAGGGISFADADWNIAVADVIFGSNLFVGLAVTPSQDQRGIYRIERVRWNGVADSGTAIKVGDGVHHISDVSVVSMSGTAATPEDMGVWVDVSPQTDTVALSHITLIRGGFGVRVGWGASGASAVTGFALQDAPAIESMTEYGVWVQSANNARLHAVSSAQNRGGVAIGSGVRGLLLTGSVLHANRGDGVTMFTGAASVVISGNVIADNNNVNAPWGFGISIGAGVSDFTISGNRLGNNLMHGYGAQRYCIFLAAGNSNRYAITQNACLGHTYGDAVVDGGTGSKKVVTQNF